MSETTERDVRTAVPHKPARDAHRDTPRSAAPVTTERHRPAATTLPARGGPRIRTRSMAEALERASLAPYATTSSDAGPRVYDEAEDPFRTALQRDRDRIIHAAAFRALQHKTQVFVVHEGEQVRTRLTHTLEVAQIARSVAGYVGANPDLAEAIALAHDFGHTAFGHAGEDELSEILTAMGLPAFDHNQATLRIVTELEQRSPRYPGLNLTYATREGLARHETAYDRPADVKAYYVTPQPGIEAQIANVADPIAYTTHDLEDSLRLGFFDADDLRELDLPIVTEALQTAEAEVADVPRPARRRFRAQLLHRTLVHRLLTALLDEVEVRLAALAPEGALPDAEAVRRADGPVVALPASLEDQLDQLRRFLHRRVYKHPRVLDMCWKGQRILRTLFEHYFAHPRHLPPRVQTRWEDQPPTDPQELGPVVCDYVAGLTDREAMDLYRVLYDPHARALLWTPESLG